MKNVIRFPIEKRIESIANEDIAYNEIIDDVEVVCEETLTVFVEDLIDCGYDVTGEDYVIYISLLYEAIKSLLYKTRNLDHPLQNLAITMYQDYITAREDSGQYEFDF